MEPVPKTLDWVKAYAECSLEKLLRDLTAVVEADVEKANRLVDGRMRFRTIPVAGTPLRVVRDRDAAGFNQSEVVEFEVQP